jgi:hypothetical protein
VSGSSTSCETKTENNESSFGKVDESICGSQPPAFGDDTRAASGNQIGDPETKDKDQKCKTDLLSKMGKIKRKSMQEMRLVQNASMMVH